MVNKVFLVGHVGSKAELKSTASGNTVCNFRMATSEKYGKGAERKDDTTWHNVVIWGKLADSVGKYIDTGKKIYVSGRISNRTFDKKDGTKGYISEIVASDLKFLDKREADEHQTFPKTLDEEDAPF